MWIVDELSFPSFDCVQCVSAVVLTPSDISCDKAGWSYVQTQFILATMLTGAQAQLQHTQNLRSPQQGGEGAVTCFFFSFLLKLCFVFGRTVVNLFVQLCLKSWL